MTREIMRSHSKKGHWKGGSPGKGKDGDVAWGGDVKGNACFFKEISKEDKLITRGGGWGINLVSLSTKERN